MATSLQAVMRHPGADTNHTIEETKQHLLEYRQVTCCQWTAIDLLNENTPNNV